MANSDLTVNLPSTEIFNLGGLSVTNSMIATLAVSLILVIAALIIRRNIGVKPSKAQVVLETLVNFMMDKMVDAFGSKERARKFFPLIFTIFIFLLVANQFSLMPIFESIILKDSGTSIFRTPTSDYSLPIALAIVVLTLSHVLALAKSPLRHIGNFIKIGEFTKIKSIKELPMACLEFFLGLLDIVGEVAKLVSISTRLFGNMFAGAVVVTIISGLTVYTTYLVPIPFLVLGILSGFVQAFVFAMLSLLYISSTLNAVDNLESSK